MRAAADAIHAAIFDQDGVVDLAKPPQLSEQMMRQSHRAFAANEINEAMAGLWQAMDAAWINDPVRDQIAGRKAYQLKVAQEAGLRIPATVITNDPVEARRFVDARGYREIVYKSFSSTEEPHGNQRPAATQAFSFSYCSGLTSTIRSTM